MISRFEIKLALIALKSSMAGGGNGRLGGYRAFDFNVNLRNLCSSCSNYIVDA